MDNIPQAFSIGLELVIVTVMIGVLAWMRALSGSQRQISETQRQISDSQHNITQTQQAISQMQREHSAILQQLITEVAVMQARQEGWRPNE